MLLGSGWQQIHIIGRYLPSLPRLAMLRHGGRERLHLFLPWLAWTPAIACLLQRAALPRRWLCSNFAVGPFRLDVSIYDKGPSRNRAGPSVIAVTTICTQTPQSAAFRFTTPPSPKGFAPPAGSLKAFSKA